MIKITNGVNVYTVTKGAFDSIFKEQGYNIIHAENHEEVHEHEDESQQPTKEEIFCESLMKKPISNWNKEETRKFTEIKELDTSSCSSLAQVKDLIKAKVLN